MPLDPPDPTPPRRIIMPGEASRPAPTEPAREPTPAPPRETPPGGVLLVTGSFYLLGDLMPSVARLPRMRGAMLLPNRSR